MASIVPSTRQRKRHRPVDPHTRDGATSINPRRDVDPPRRSFRERHDPREPAAQSSLARPASVLACPQAQPRRVPKPAADQAPAIRLGGLRQRSGGPAQLLPDGWQRRGGRPLTGSITGVPARGLAMRARQRQTVREIAAGAATCHSTTLPHPRRSGRQPTTPRPHCLDAPRARRGRRGPSLPP